MSRGPVLFDKVHLTRGLDFSTPTGLDGDMGVAVSVFNGLMQIRAHGSAFPCSDVPTMMMKASVLAAVSSSPGCTICFRDSICSPTL